MTQVFKPRVLVVGGGPGGYVAAIRAGQLGLETVLVDGDRLGGTCLIRGCIPSKALIHAATFYHDSCHAADGGEKYGVRLSTRPTLDFSSTLRWKDGVVNRLSDGVFGLLRRAKVKVVTGWAVFSDAKSCTVETEEGPVAIEAEHVILATGSHPVELASLPFGQNIISSSEALSLPDVPGTLAVVGGGYIGLELGIAFAKLGASVSIVEAQDRILPLYDAKLTEPVRRWLGRHKVALQVKAKARGFNDGSLEIQTGEGDRVALAADKVLVTIGRRPNTSGWGLDAMALAMDGPFVKVDDRCATSTTGVWAIGDLVGNPMLAHKASSQGEMVAEIIAGHRRRFDARAIPAICFTEPEIVSVGLGPDDVPSGVETISGSFPFAANGRALSMGAGEDGGFVRVIARADNHRILGIHCVGAHVSELAAQFVSLVEMGAVLEDVTGIVHAHPTLGEAVHEASLKALGRAIHI